jgi:signal recognition particle GTPase
MMGMMPGMGKMKKADGAAGIDDKVFKRQIAIITSMTKAERANAPTSEGQAQEAHRRRLRPDQGRSREEPSTSCSRCTAAWPT